MPERIDAGGLGCTKLIILAKKALESLDEVTLIVDGGIALENIKALGNYE